MAKVSAKGAAISVNSQVMSTDITAYEITYEAPAVDVTGFSDGAHNYVGGMPVREMTMDILWDTAATTGSYTVLQPLIGTTTTVSITPEATKSAFSGTFLVVGIYPQADPSGAIKLGTVKFVPGSSTAPSWA
jgi:hypothetical protein